MCFTCRGGSRGVGCLTKLGGLVRWSGSAKKTSSRAWAEEEEGEVGFVVFYEGLRL